MPTGPCHGRLLRGEDSERDVAQPEAILEAVKLLGPFRRNPSHVCLLDDFTDNWVL
jgi:hypothetical protein